MAFPSGYERNCSKAEKQRVRRIYRRAPENAGVPPRGKAFFFGRGEAESEVGEGWNAEPGRGDSNGLVLQKKLKKVWPGLTEIWLELAFQIQVGRPMAALFYI